jgi:hypothetical protein
MWGHEDQALKRNKAPIMDLHEAWNKVEKSPGAVKFRGGKRAMPKK